MSGDTLGYQRDAPTELIVLYSTINRYYNEFSNAYEGCKVPRQGYNYK